MIVIISDNQCNPMNNNQVPCVTSDFEHDDNKVIPLSSLLIEFLAAPVTSSRNSTKGSEMKRKEGEYFG